MLVSMSRRLNLEGDAPGLAAAASSRLARGAAALMVARAARAVAARAVRICGYEGGLVIGKWGISEWGRHRYSASLNTSTELNSPIRRAMGGGATPWLGVRALGRRMEAGLGRELQFGIGGLPYVTRENGGEPGQSSG